MRDYYEVLEISISSSGEDIQKAYLKLAKKYHPDVNADEQASIKFKEIQNAYDTLSDPVKKSLYDLGRNKKSMHFRTRSPRKPRYESTSTSQHFEDVMSEYFGSTSTFRGRNIQIRVEISFEEAYAGCTRFVKIKKKKRCDSCDGSGFASFAPCHNCNGSGVVKSAINAPFMLNADCPACFGSGKAKTVACKNCQGGFSHEMAEKGVEVKIPPGFATGMQIRILNEGEESSKITGKTGDLFVIVLVKEHSLFKREAQNLILDVPVSYTQLVLGDTIYVPTITNEKYKIDIPKGCQTGTKFRIKNRGFPSPKGLGDLIVTLKLEIPKDIKDNDYNELISKLSEMEKKHVSAKREEWTKKTSANSK